MENGLVNLINTLPVGKFRHAVLCIEDYSNFRERITRPDVEVIALHRSQIGVWKMRKSIFHICRRLQPTIIHTRNMSGLDALLPARLAGVPHCIHGEHGWDVNNLDGKKKKPALLRLLHTPLVSHYITVSKHLQEYLIKRVGINSSRITQIYNGVDTERFRPTSAPSTHLLPTNFQGKDKLLIGTVGRIQPVKDQATLLYAFAQLTQAQPQLKSYLRLVVVGDGPLLIELRQLAEALNIAAQTWFPGALNVIPEVLQNLDLFVLPSLNEGISNTILEAMSSGLTTLATAVGGNTELVIQDVSGQLFPPQDCGQLAQQLQKYVSTPNLLTSQGLAARCLAEQRFSLDTMIAAYESVYDHFCT